MKLSKYLYIAPVKKENNLEKVFVFSTRSSLSTLIRTDTLKKFQTNDFSNIPESLMDKLIKYKIIVPKEENEFASILKENKFFKEKNDILSITIQPTANCQFGCHYCGQEHINHQMDNDVEDFCINRIKHILDTTPKYKKLKITWYGGEPLLGLTTIRSLSYKLQDLCKSYGIKYRADMVTNGYLLKKDIFKNLLLEHKVKSYQITLDGISESHDQRRVLKKNRGKTFDTIYKNIKEIVTSYEYISEDARIQIRINIDKKNYKEVDKLMYMLVEDKIANKIYISFAPVEDWGGNNAGKDSFSHEDFSIHHMKWTRFCIENNISTASLIPTRSFSSCMVESEHNEVIDAFGNVYPCWEFPYSAYKDERNMIASKNRPFDTKQSKTTLLDFSEKIKNGTYECFKCIFYPLCGGGCPLALYEKRNACPTYKFDIKQRLITDYEIRRKERENA